ncbi:MAG: DUF433 domain-containing protein [Chromatiaceae bacterium]|nr:DUF433 domain-containing protein [Chromatiaceae bacterium]
MRFETRVGAAVIKKDPKLLRQEVTRVLGPLVAPVAGRRPKMGFRELLYFRLIASLQNEGVQIRTQDRSELYEVLGARKRHVGQWSRAGQKLQRAGEVPLTLDLGGITAGLRDALRHYYQGAAQVECRQDICSGQPVFKGTRIPVAQVVGLFRKGVPMIEIAEDYPGIGIKGLQYAEIRARMGNAPGRPVKDLELRYR